MTCNDRELSPGEKEAISIETHAGIYARRIYPGSELSVYPQLKSLMINKG